MFSLPQCVRQPRMSILKILLSKCMCHSSANDDNLGGRDDADVSELFPSCLITDDACASVVRCRAEDQTLLCGWGPHG